MSSHPAESDAVEETFELEDSRPLFLMTFLLGLLVGLDLILPLVGYSNAFWGVRYSLWAAVLWGARTLHGSLEGVFEGQIGADFSLAIACIAAILIGEPLVAAEVVLIGMIGESLEAITFGRTRRELHALLQLCPPTARVVRDGVEHVIPTDDLAIGDRIVVRPGERIPADATVLAGRSSVDQSALTGESLPADKEVGDLVLAGTLNHHGALEVSATRVGIETSFGKLLGLIAEAQERKAPLERTADRYAAWFLPAVLFCAALTFLFTRDVLRTVAVLVVACPCALILATPAAVLAAVARLARRGVVLRGGLAIERLANATALVFDKTGTLTEGRPVLGDVVPLPGHDEEEVLWCAATAERNSEHVLAGVIVQAARERSITPGPADDFLALPGAGVRSRTGDETLLVGNLRLLRDHAVPISEELTGRLEQIERTGQTPLIVARGSSAIGVVGVRDPIREQAADAIDELRRLGFDPIALVTGDRLAPALAVALRFKITQVRAEQMPADKVAFIEEWRRQGHRVAMIGDGINDAPALAISDVGLALGSVGSAAAAEAGDVVLLREPLSPLPFAVRLARQTVRVMRQNIILFAFVVNGTAILLSAWGVLPPIGAAIYHQCGSLLVLLNSMRLLFFEREGHSWLARVQGDAGSLLGQGVPWLNPMTTFEFVVARWRGLAWTALAAAAVAYLASGIRIVEPDELAVRKRFGRFHSQSGPGLSIGLPTPFDEVIKLKPAEVRVAEIGFRSLPITNDDAPAPLTIEWNSPHRDGLLQPRPEEGLMLTGDESLAELNVAIQYRVADPRAFLFGTANLEAILPVLAEAVLRSLTARIPEDDLLTTGRSRFESQARELLAQRVGANGYTLGIEIVAVVLRDVHPPLDVVGAYHEVSSAMEQRERMIHQGEAYRSETVFRAEADGAQRTLIAEGEGIRRTSQAVATRDAFLEKRAAYALAPALTRLRMHWEMIEDSLAGRPKVLLDPKASRHRRILLGGQEVADPTLLPAIDDQTPAEEQ